MSVEPSSTSQARNRQGCLSVSEIDDRIEYHLQELRLLRKQRNELASRTQCLLPTDILLSIFMLYQKREVFDFVARTRPSSWPHPEPLQPRAPVPYLLPSQVCVHWRRTLLSFPPFWSIFFLNSIQWTKELLLRSKTSPLHLYIRIRTQTSDGWAIRPFGEEDPLLKCLQILLPENQRFETLDLDTTQLSLGPLSISKRLIKALKMALPCLSHLRFTVGNGYNPSAHSSIGHASDLSSRLGKKFPTTLRSLEVITRSPASFGSKFASSSLTRLECRDIPLQNRPQVSFYLQLLHRLPALEILILDGALPSTPEEGLFGRLDHVSLKKVFLRGFDVSISVFAQVVEYLNLSPLVSLHLSGRCFPATNIYSEEAAWRSSDTETLRKELKSLFLALQPSLHSSCYRSATNVDSPYPFHSMLVETGYNALTIAFKRDECIIIDKVLLIAAPLVNNFQFWEYSNLDIQVELQGLDALTPDLEEPALNPSAIVLEHVRDIVESVEHFVLLEVPENRAGSSLPSLVPWIEALSTSKTLKQLDTKLALCLQPLAWFLDQWRLQRLDGDDGPMSFPSLEHLIIREVRFCLPPPESLESPTTPSLPLVNEQVGDDTSSLPLSSSLPLQTNILQLDNTGEQELSTETGCVHSNSPSPTAWQPHRLLYNILPSTFLPPSQHGMDFPRVFRERKAAGHRLQRLTFRNCASFSPSVAYHYQDIVGAVEWDGIDSIFWDPWLPPSSPAPPLAGDQTSSDESEEEL